MRFYANSILTLNELLKNNQNTFKSLTNPENNDDNLKRVILFLDFQGPLSSYEGHCQNDINRDLFKKASGISKFSHLEIDLLAEQLGTGKYNFKRFNEKQSTILNNVSDLKTNAFHYLYCSTVACDALDRNVLNKIHSFKSQLSTLGIDLIVYCISSSGFSFNQTYLTNFYFHLNNLNNKHNSINNPKLLNIVYKNRSSLLPKNKQLFNPVFSLINLDKFIHAFTKTANQKQRFSELKMIFENRFKNNQSKDFIKSLRYCYQAYKLLRYIDLKTISFPVENNLNQLLINQLAEIKKKSEAIRSFNLFSFENKKETNEFGLISFLNQLDDKSFCYFIDVLNKKFKKLYPKTMKSHFYELSDFMLSSLYIYFLESEQVNNLETINLDNIIEYLFPTIKSFTDLMIIYNETRLNFVGAGNTSGQGDCRLKSTLTILELEKEKMKIKNLPVFIDDMEVKDEEIKKQFEDNYFGLEYSSLTGMVNDKILSEILLKV